MALATARRAWLLAMAGAVFGAMLFMHAAMFAQMVLGGMIDRDDPTPSV